MTAKPDAIEILVQHQRAALVRHGTPMDRAQAEAEDMMRRLAREEGIFCGVSSGGAVAAMLKLARETENAVMVAIICDRGDRYLSSGLFN